MPLTLRAFIAHLKRSHSVFVRFFWFFLTRYFLGKQKYFEKRRSTTFKSLISSFSGNIANRFFGGSRDSLFPCFFINAFAASLSSRLSSNADNSGETFCHSFTFVCRCFLVGMNFTILFWLKFPLLDKLSTRYLIRV